MSFFLLLLPLLFGSLFALQVMNEKHPLFFLPLGSGIATVTGLMLLDLFLLWGLALDQAMWSLYGFFGVGSAWLGWKIWKSGVEVPRLAVSRVVWAYLAVSVLAIHLISMALTFMEIDPDFWVHSPMQAQLLNNVYPPVNPILPNIAYGGHFAKDLLVVAVSWTSGAELLVCHAPVTSFLQVNAFLLLFLAAYSERGQYAGMFVSFLVFTGANVGFRGGWLDALANNTSLSNLHTALLLMMLIRTLFRRVCRAEVLMTGVLFGGLAWTYETNFVPLSAGLGLLAVLTALIGKFTKRRAVLALWLCTAACLCGLVYGGLLGDLLRAKMTSQAPTARDERVQAQEVTISAQFPKQHLFQVKMTRPGEVLSIAYRVFEPLNKRFQDPGNVGYVSLWEPVFLRMHWLALYAAPFTFWALWRRWKNEEEPRAFGLCLWCVGAASLLIPAVVDFGIWEEEVFRWMFTAGWAFAGALGFVLGEVCERSSASGLWRVEEGVVSFGKPFAQVVGSLLLAFLLGYPVLQITRDKMRALPSRHSCWWVYRQQDWLDYHFHELGLSRSQAELAEALREVLKSRDVLVSNFALTSYHSMKQEEAFLGLCGALPLGHALPTTFERLGTPPFRMDAPTRAFWATGDPELLRAEPPDWVYYQSTERGRAPEGLDKILERSDSHGSYEIYRFDLPELSLSQIDEDTLAGLELGEFIPDESLVTERYLQSRLSIQSEKPLEGNFLIEYRFPGQPLEKGLTQPCGLKLEPSVSRAIPLHFVTPHHSGRFEVEFVLHHSSGEHVLGRQVVSVDNASAWSKLKVTWKSRERERFTVEVENQGELPISVDGFAGVLPENPAGLDLQPVRFRLAAKERTVLHLFWDFSLALPERLRLFEDDRRRDYPLGPVETQVTRKL